MRNEEKYTTVEGKLFIDEEGKTPNLPKKVISDDAYAICEALQELTDSIDLLRVKI